MPGKRSLHLVNDAHRLAMAITGGRFGWTARGMPVLELTTTGRKSGEPRTTMLTAPLTPGDSYVIVASRGGDPKHPAWFLNIQADPLVTVRTRNGTQRMRAHVATSAEREVLWPEITAKHRHYAGYQSKTDREIPVVILEPRG